jgi:hypothetical protein
MLPSTTFAEQPVASVSIASLSVCLPKEIFTFALSAPAFTTSPLLTVTVALSVIVAPVTTVRVVPFTFTVAVFCS